MSHRRIRPCGPSPRLRSVWQSTPRAPSEPSPSAPQPPISIALLPRRRPADGASPLVVVLVVAAWMLRGACRGPCSRSSRARDRRRNELSARCHHPRDPWHEGRARPTSSGRRVNSSPRTPGVQSHHPSGQADRGVPNPVQGGPSHSWRSRLPARPDHRTPYRLRPARQPDGVPSSQGI